MLKLLEGLAVWTSEVSYSADTLKQDTVSYISFPGYVSKALSKLLCGAGEMAQI